MTSLSKISGIEYNTSRVKICTKTFLEFIFKLIYNICGHVIADLTGTHVTYSFYSRITANAEADTFEHWVQNSNNL